MATVQSCLAALIWLFLPGWVLQLWSIPDAAHTNPRS